MLLFQGKACGADQAGLNAALGGDDEGLLDLAQDAAADGIIEAGKEGRRIGKATPDGDDVGTDNVDNEGEGGSDEVDEDVDRSRGPGVASLPGGDDLAA